jgi:hypothetical protein
MKQSTNDQIQWCSKAGTATVKFTPGWTPLYGGVINVTTTGGTPQNGVTGYSCSPLYKLGTVSPGLRYKHTITDDSGTISEDPQVIIDNDSLFFIDLSKYALPLSVGLGLSLIMVAYLAIRLMRMQRSR